MSRHLAGAHRESRDHLGTIFVGAFAVSALCTGTMVVGAHGPTTDGIANAAEPSAPLSQDPLGGASPSGQPRGPIMLPRQRGPVPEPLTPLATVPPQRVAPSNPTQADEAGAALVAPQATAETPPAPVDASTPSTAAPAVEPLSLPKQPPTTTSSPPPPTTVPSANPGVTPPTVEPNTADSETSATSVTSTTTATEPDPTTSEPDAGEDADPTPTPTERDHHGKACNHPGHGKPKWCP